jgi:type I protein arginine methyltransferase
MPKISDLVIELLLRLRNWLRERPAVKRVLYEKWSRETFANPYIHEIMLSDRVRVDAYRRAIERYVGSGDVVVDVGTGTGLLARLAAKMRPAKIYAIDHSDVIHAAERAWSDPRDNVEFVKVHSNRFEPPSKVSVILHEQIGYYLFDERFVENLTALRDRVLAPGGRILPARFEFFIEPMMLHDEFRIPFVWQIDVHGVRFEAMKETNAEWQQFATGGRISSYVEQRIGPHKVKHMLCDPEKLFDIDLETMRPGDIPKRMQYARTVVQDGRLDVLGIYFSVKFDDDIGFDTSPRSPATHWENVCVRLEGEDVRRGDVIEFDWAFDDIAVFHSWRLKYRIRRQAVETTDYRVAHA